MQSIPAGSTWVVSDEWPAEEGIFTVVGDLLTDCQNEILSIDTSKPDPEAATDEPYVANFAVSNENGLIAWWDRIQDTS